MCTDKTIFAEMLWRATGSHVTVRCTNRKWPEVCSMHAQPIPALFSYYSSTKWSTVVQVPWLPEVTEGHVTTSGFHWVCACPTGSRAISALVGSFHHKWRYETSPIVTKSHVTTTWKTYGEMKCFITSCTRKVGSIVKRFGKYRRKVSWRVKRYGNYGRKISWNVKRY
jgi:hypothetical protein